MSFYRQPGESLFSHRQDYSKVKMLFPKINLPPLLLLALPQPIPFPTIQALTQEGALLCASLCAKVREAIQAKHWTEVKTLGKELQEVSWESLHSGAAWREVTVTIRRAYAHSQFVLAAAEIVQMQQDGYSDTAETCLKECMRRLDMALLMGPPDIQAEANGLIDWVQDELLQHLPQKPLLPARKRFRPSKARINDEEDDIPRLACPSLHAFLDQHMKPQVPVILTDGLEHWPALKLWRDLNYLKRVAGQRVVPVEVGTGTYLTAETEEEGEDEEGGEWGQQLMPLTDFIERYVVDACSEVDGGEGEFGRESVKNLMVSGADAKLEYTSGGGEGEGIGRDVGKIEGKTNRALRDKRKKKGYLAQHELFEQVAALKKDIYVPDYCALEVDEEGEEEEDGQVILHAWFGPGGTVSPTHTDPYHNLLAQVVGSKAVRLFAPSQSPYLYAHEGLLNNNSRVNVQKPDLEKFPLFAQAKSQRCVLKEGEMLYIPPLWWHHIESLETSFSVSFWWGRRRG